MLRILLSWVFLSSLVACETRPVDDAPPIRITVPHGATFQVVVDTLESRGLVGKPLFFRAYARWKKADTKVRAGAYSIRPGISWSDLLEILTAGRVLMETLTIPEGFRLTQIAPRVAEITGLTSDSVLDVLRADSSEHRWGVPGPGLEGYLFPDTYWIAQGAPLDSVLGAMIQRYREFWTPERVTRREALGMTEREVVTLASIVQAEARVEGEMPLIASVYHNRLGRGQLLQADPTVLYALGGHRERLLYAAMDSVADHPYNTYTRPGLPPGPIGAPGDRALESALNPAETDFYYFVARTDGSHVFSATLAEHNRNVARLRPEWERFRREQEQGREEGRGGTQEQEQG
ncbi:MAG: endolytic transglycosylase MltG [Longimicrobiales bacterium]